MTRQVYIVLAVILSVNILFPGTFLANTAFAQVFKPAKTLIDRGMDYEKYDNHDGTFTAVLGADPWVYDDSAAKWVPHIVNTVSSSYVEVRSGMIGWIIRQDDAVITDSDMTQINAVERWVPKIAGVAIPMKFVSQAIDTNSTGVFVTNKYSLSYLSRTVGVDVLYAIFDGAPTKRIVTLSNVPPLAASLLSLDREWTTSSPNAIAIDNSVDTIQSTAKNATIDDSRSLATLLRAGKPFISEVLQTSAPKLKSIEYDRQKTVFSYSGFSALDTKLVDGTYTNPSASFDEYVQTNNAQGSSCPTSSFSTGDTTFLQVSKSIVTLNGGCLRAWVEWSTSSVPAGSTITATQFKFDSISNSDINCDYTPMVQNGANPSGMTAAQKWTEIGDGTPYLANDATCQTFAHNLTVTLGSAANTDLQNKLGNGNYFAVGIKLNSETRDGTNHVFQIGASNDPSSTPRPTLIVTYYQSFSGPLSETITSSPDVNINVGKPIAETITSNPAVATAINRVVSKSENLTASPAVNPDLLASRAVAQSLTAGPTVKINVGKSPSQTITASPVVAYSLVAGRPDSETVTFTATVHFSVTRSQASTVTVSPTVATDLDASRDEAENVTTTATVNFQITRSVAQSLNVSPTVSIVIVHPLSESLTATPSVDPTLSASRSDSETITSSPAVSINVGKLPSQTITVSPAVSKSLVAGRAVSQTITTTATVTITVTKGLSESITAGPSISLSLVASRPLSQTITLSPAVSITITRGLAESFTTAPAVSVSLSATRGPSNTITTSPAVSTQMLAERDESESFNVTASIGTTVIHVVTQPIKLINGASTPTFEADGTYATITCHTVDQHDGNPQSQSFTCNPSETVTISLPSGNSTLRWIWSDGTTADKSITSCSSGTCTEPSYTYYKQIQKDLTLTGLYSVNATRTVLGTSGWEPVGTGNDYYLSFDGVNDYVSIAYNSALAPTTGIGYGGFFYNPHWSGLTTAGQHSLISKTETGGYNLSYDDAANGLSDQVGCLIRSNSVYQSPGYPLSSLSDGWHHFFCDYDGRYAKFFVDGDLKETVDAGGSFPIQYSVSNSLIIGAEAGASTTPAAGTFANVYGEDIIVFGAAPSDLDVKGMAEGVTPSGDIRVWFKLNDGSGTSAGDSSGNGRTGTLNNGPVWTQHLWLDYGTTLSFPASVQITANERWYTNDQTTFTVTDASSVTLDYIKEWQNPLADAVTVSPAVTRLIFSSRQVSQSVAVTASVNVAVTRSESEALTVSPAVDTNLALGRGESESLTVDQNVNFKVTRGESESLNVSSSISLQVARAIPQSLTVSPSVGRSLVTTRAESESLTITPSVGIVVTRPISQSLSVTPAVSKSLAASRSESEPLTVNATVSITLPRSQSDTVTVSPSIATTLVSARGVSESLTVNDTVSIGLARAQAAAVTISPTIDTTLGASRSISNTVSVGASVNLSVTRATSQTLTVAPAVATKLTINRGESESVAVGQAIATTLGANRSPSDTVNITTAVALKVTRAIPQTVTITPSVATSLGAARGEAQSVTVTPAVTIKITRSLTQTLSASDSISYNVKRSLAETASVSPSITRLLNSTRGPSDSAVITDSVNYTLIAVVHQPIKLVNGNGTDTFEADGTFATIDCHFSWQHDGSPQSQTIDCNPSETITIHLPAGTPTMQYVWSDGSTGDIQFLSCSSGECPEATFTYFQQYKQTITPAGVDFSQLVNVTRTQAGTPGTTIIHGSVASTMWADKGTPVIIPDTVVVTPDQDRFKSYSNSSLLEYTADNSYSKAPTYQRELNTLFRVHEKHLGFLFEPMPPSTYTVRITTSNGTSLNLAINTLAEDDITAPQEGRYWVSNGTATWSNLQWLGTTVNAAGSQTITADGEITIESKSKHFGFFNSRNNQHFRLAANNGTIDESTVGYDISEGTFTFKYALPASDFSKVEFLTNLYSTVSVVQVDGQAIDSSRWTVVNGQYSGTGILVINNLPAGVHTVFLKFLSSGEGGSNSGSGSGGGGLFIPVPGVTIGIPVPNNPFTPPPTPQIGLNVSVEPVTVVPGKPVLTYVTVKWNGATSVQITDIQFTKNPSYFRVDEQLPIVAAITGGENGTVLERKIPITVTVPDDVKSLTVDDQVQVTATTGPGATSVKAEPFTLGITSTSNLAVLYGIAIFAFAGVGIVLAKKIRSR